jgi:hypothetical protein
VILFLIHFRHYIPDILLSSMFNISKVTAYRAHHRMRTWMYQLLSPELSWHDYTWRWNHGGIVFNGQVVTFLVDGSEQKVVAPEEPRLNTGYYSGKKSHPSINIVA